MPVVVLVLRGLRLRLRGLPGSVLRTNRALRRRAARLGAHPLLLDRTLALIGNAVRRLRARRPGVAGVLTRLRASIYVTIGSRRLARADLLLGGIQAVPVELPIAVRLTLRPNLPLGLHLPLGLDLPLRPHVTFLAYVTVESIASATVAGAISGGR